MKIKKIIAILIIVLLSMTQLAAASNDTNMNKTSFSSVLESVKNDDQGNALVVYKDEDRDFILFYLGGKLQSYKQGEARDYDSSYSGNMPFIYNTNEGYYYGQVEESPDKNLILFYDENGHTFIYSISEATLKTIPVTFAKVVWNVSGNDYEFASRQIIRREGMSSVLVRQVGLFIKNKEGELVQAINDDKSVGFLGRRSDGVHFLVQGFINSYDLMYEAWGQEVVYDAKKNNVKYIPYIPQNTKVILHKNLNGYSSLSENNAIFPGKIMIFNNKYILAPISNRHIRFNKVTKEVKTIPVPIAFYKNNIYYFQKPNISGPIDKMNISTLKASKTSIGYAASYGYVFYKNAIYFLNPQKDSKGNYIDVMCSYNLDNGRITKNTEAPALNEYHVFILKNKYRLCVYFNHSTIPSIHLEDSEGQLVLPSVQEYSEGYFYQTGISEEGFPAIYKVDINGKTVKQVFVAHSKDIQFTSVKVVGNSLFFTTGTNFYICDMKSGKYEKY